MKKIIIVTLILVFILASLTGCSLNANKKLTVAVSIYPFYDAVKSIAGDLVDVVLVVPVGSSPHTYTLTPKDVSNLSNAKVIFVNDFGLEEFLSSLIKSTGLEVVNVSDQFKDVVEKHDGNPHLWLNPEYFVSQSKVILDTLVKLDPAHKGTYEKNFNTYSENILKNASELKDKISKLKNRNIITFHDAFPYFAEYFNLNIVKSVEPDPNKLPMPQDIIEIENLIKKYNIKVVFKEPQLSSDIFKAIVEDTHVKVLSLDPLGGGESTKTYVDLMKYNVNAIYDALNEW